MLKTELENEIEKWKKRLDEKLPKTEEKDDDGKWILENARAYREDSEHFYKNEDLVQSFESLVWAWAFIEIGENLGHLKEK